MLSSVVWGQTTLNLGDIAFTGYQSDGSPDLVSFVLLKDITAGTTITFTENGWLSVGGFRTGEGTVLWSANSDLSYGTQVEFNDGKGTLSTVSGSFALSTGGDQVFAYQGMPPTASDQSSFIAAIQMNGSWDADATSTNTSAKPSIFTDGLNSISISPEVDNSVYNCAITSSDPNVLRSAVNNSSNWTTSNAVGLSIPPCGGLPLPVELTTFSASMIDNNVELNWETATEVNNYGFEIHRLQNYKNEKLQDWEKVGFVEGHGNSNSPKYYSFTDNTVETSGKYSYRLKQIDIDGSFEYSDVVEVNLGTPEKFELNQNYPNPFNPTTSIQFSLPNDSQVKLSVYNVLGEEVAELLNGNIAAGYHNVTFNANTLNSGIYFYKLETGNFTQIRKMMLVK